jgi:hypothetical protein
MLTVVRQPTRYKARTSPFFLMLTPHKILAAEAQIADLRLWVKLPRQGSLPQLALFRSSLTG